MDSWEREALARSIVQEIEKSDLAKEIAKEIELARTARKKEERDVRAGGITFMLLLITVSAVFYGIFWVGARLLG